MSRIRKVLESLINENSLLKEILPNNTPKEYLKGMKYLVDEDELLMNNTTEYELFKKLSNSDSKVEKKELDNNSFILATNSDKSKYLFIKSNGAEFLVSNVPIKF